MKAIALVQTTDRTINQLQQNITQSVNPLINNPVTGGNLVSTQKLSIGANTINHGLGTAIQGYMITSSTAPSTYSDNIQSNPNASTSFVLTSTAATTVNIYCF